MGETDGKEWEEEIRGVGKGGKVVVMPSEQDKVLEALAVGKELVIVRVGNGGIGARPQDVEMMLRQMLEAT